MAAEPALIPAEPLPGPTGESNHLTLHGRGVALCLGGGTDSDAALVEQAFLALAAGNAVALAQNHGAGSVGHVAEALRRGGVPAALVAPVAPSALSDFPDLAIVVFDGSDELAAPIRRDLAARDGLRIRLTSLRDGVEPFATERVVSIDTTASGGNASLLTLGDG